MNPPHRLRLFSDKMRKRAKRIRAIYGAGSDGEVIADLIDGMADVCLAALPYARREDKPTPLSMAFLRLVDKLDRVTPPAKAGKGGRGG